MKTIVQSSLYGLLMLASAILSLAEGAGFPNALTIPLAMLALFVTDRWQLFQLRTRWANVLGLLAFVAATWEFLGDDIEARLLSLAHLLVYLTWIVLFMAKTTRQYWTMCALSILHVAIGAVLTSSETFGILTIVFLFASIWTLSVFTLDRTRMAYAVEPLSLTTAVNSRMETNVWCWNRPSRPVNAAQLDARMKWVCWSFGGGVVANVFLSSIIAALFFLFTPRIWVGNFSAFGETADRPLKLSKTGFTDEVRLGDIGQILEGTAVVLEARLADQQSGQPIDIERYSQQLGLDEPLFRGAVLGEYESGRWRAGSTGERDGVRVLPPNLLGAGIRQEFRVQPMDSNILFAIPTHSACRLDHKQPHVFERRLTSVLYRDDGVSTREALNYSVFAESTADGLARQRAIGAGGSWLYAGERDFYRRMPAQGLERLKSLAEQVASDISDGRESTLEVRAERIERFLRSSGQFHYSLNMSIDDPTIDAVEDFLFNRREGHCEYFASALALMLRAVDIPARMVSGFKGGDLNHSTGFWMVQQRHAHVWVEAYLDRKWLIFDATPASRSASVDALAPKPSLWNSLRQFFSDVWSNHVVGMNMAEQNSNVYTPMKGLFDNAKDSLEEHLEALRSGDLSVLTWTIVLPTLGVAILVIAMTWTLLSLKSKAQSRQLGWFGTVLWNFARWLFPNSDRATAATSSWQIRFRDWWRSLVAKWMSNSPRMSRRVEFYERFLRLFRTVGLEPLATQTAHEFVLETEPLWSERLRATASADTPNNIVSMFYRVRFGDEELSPEEVRQLEEQLRTLESEWRRRASTDRLRRREHLP